MISVRPLNSLTAPVTETVSPSATSFTPAGEKTKSARDADAGSISPPGTAPGIWMTYPWNPPVG